MFFNKHIIHCKIKCISRKTLYGIDENGHNTFNNEFAFIFIEPENRRVLYQYNENSNKYKINHLYKAKFNYDDGSFKIIKEIFD